MVLNFNGLPIGATQEVVLADRVDILNWLEITPMLRVHTHSLSGGVGSIVIGMYGQSLSAQDPGMFFLNKNIPLLITLDSSVPKPGYLAVPFSGALAIAAPPLLQI